MPRGHYFLLGDLRGASCDGFVSGPAPREDVIAEVVAVYWPPTRIGLR